MSTKQDRVSARTPTDLERKYNFGKTFAEMFGLANEAKRAADAAKDAVDDFDNALTPEEIFNRLTDNGKVQGIYRDEDGQIYINASYLATGILASRDGSTFYLDLDKGILKGTFAEFSISGKTLDEIYAENLNEYAEEIAKDIENLQNQIDGNITSWFGDYVPTTSNEPASEWTTDDLKSVHLGDLFYINEGVEQGGTVYRWTFTNGVYSWVIVEDTDIAKALAAASKAQDTADSKRRVFVVTPIPPYDVGDLWAQGSTGDLMRCKTARAEGASYVASDWELASNYINAESAEQIAQGKVDAQTQEDIFNKLTNNGQEQGVYLKNGKLYLNGTYLNTGILVATLIKTGILQSKDGKSFYLDLDNNTLKADFTEMTISGKSVDTIAQEKVEAQTQADVFNKLTNNGATQGIYLNNGLLYINGSYIKSGLIQASVIDADNLKIKAANITGTLTASQIDATNLKVDAANITGTIEANTINAVDGYIGGWTITSQGLFRGTSGTSNFIGLYSQHPNTAATIGGLSSANWRIVAGTAFGVTRDGKLAASDAVISGKITATSGKIGPWSVDDVTLYSGTTLLYSGKALTAYSNGTQVALTPEYLYVKTLNSYGDYVTYAAKWTKLAALVQ